MISFVPGEGGGQETRVAAGSWIQCLLLTFRAGLQPPPVYAAASQASSIVSSKGPLVIHY